MKRLFKGGTVVSGRAEQVYLRGTLAAQNGKILVEKTGKYIPHGAGMEA